MPRILAFVVVLFFSNTSLFASESLKSVAKHYTLNAQGVTVLKQKIKPLKGLVLWLKLNLKS